MSSTLLGHPFVAATMERTRSLSLDGIKNVLEQPGHEAKAQAENRARMDAADRYEAQVHRQTLGLMTTIQVLEDARHMIRVFPKQLTRGTTGVSRDRWVDYHYGYFTVSLASLPDVSTLLAATVLQLGLAPRHCTDDIVLSHNVVKSTAVASALRSLSKSVTQVKNRRNLHVHRAEHADVEDLTSDGVLRDLKSITFVQSVTPGFTDAQRLRAAWRDAMLTISPRLDEETAQTEDGISKVLDALLPVFTRRSDALRRLRGKRRRRSNKSDSA